MYELKLNVRIMKIDKLGGTCFFTLVWFWGWENNAMPVNLGIPAAAATFTFNIDERMRKEWVTWEYLLPPLPLCFLTFNIDERGEEKTWEYLLLPPPLCFFTFNMAGTFSATSSCVEDNCDFFLCLVLVSRHSWHMTPQFKIHENMRRSNCERTLVWLGLVSQCPRPPEPTNREV